MHAWSFYKKQMCFENFAFKKERKEKLKKKKGLCD